MDKNALISAALSVVVVILLALHQQLVTLMGHQDWLNMLFGAPVGVATAVNIDLVVHKIRRGK
jgi:hypothetical protein